MILQMFIFFEMIVVGLFIASFFTKQEILWALTSVISGVLMITSYSIQYYVYEYNATVGAYVPVETTSTYPYLMGINMLFFVLALVLGIFDVFDKYGTKFAGKKEE